jgi:hypothetical protein
MDSFGGGGFGSVPNRLQPGEFAQVKIIGHTDYDLIAEPA